jgi:CIC family chloride channel protein
MIFKSDIALSYLKGLTLAVLIGILGAAAASAFRWSLEALTEQLFQTPADITEIFARLAWYWRLAIPLAGGTLAGLILLWAQKREAAQPATEPRALDYLETIDERIDHIPVLSSLARCLSSFFSIVSGGSLGKEGAMIQLSATAASVVANRYAALRGERFRLTIAMGATGGLAAVYHTPLAAAVFIAEIAFGGLEVRRIGLLFTSAVAAAWAVSMTGEFTPLYYLPAYNFDLKSAAVLAVIATGVAAGAVGAIFLALTRHGKRLFGRLPMGLPARMALGGLIVGAIAILAPDVTGNGFAPISRLLVGQSLAQPLWLLLLLKVIATAAIVGSGAIGGLFTPALLIGALVGMSGAPWLAAVLHLPESTVMLGVAGMAATLAATTQAPLMSTLMVFEMTQESSFVFPLMIASVVAYATSNILGQPGVYAVIARHQRRSASRTRLYDATVEELARAPRQMVSANASLREARELGLGLRSRFVFVADADSRYLGAVSLHDIVAACQAGDPDRALASLPYTEVAVVYRGQKAFEVWKAVVESPAEHTPVLADPGSMRVIGVLRKSDLLNEARSLFE